MDAMRALRGIFKISLVIPLIGCAMSGQGKDAANLEAKLSLLASKVQAGAIERVEILAVPLDTITRILISPENLEKAYTSKLILGGPKPIKSRGDLVSELQSAKVKLADQEFDYRTGIIFYGQGGAREAAVFFDKTGRHASIDGASVSLDRGLYGWLSSNYLGCVQ
jgi:hypothetical protein